MIKNRAPFSRVVTFLLAGMLTAASVVTAHGQETSYNAVFGNNKEAVPVNVLVGQSRVINFDQPIGRFSVSNPDIAEAVLVAPDQVLVNGKAFGQVNFIAWEKTTQRFIVFDVFVRVNLSLIDSQIRALFPKDDIRLSQANGSVVISGSVVDPNSAAQVEAVVQAAGFKTVNMLQSPVKNATQVQLQIRVAEVNRNKLKDYALTPVYQGSPGSGGYVNPGGGPYTLGRVDQGNLFGSVANTLNLMVMGKNAFVFLRALQQQGALRALAEPNLIAMDGQQASFLAGGEFPIPIVQGGGNGGNAISIMFKEFGVRLNFKPKILDENHIRLELEPEVSTLDWSNGLQIDGFTIPALRTRRAKTGIELADGQSFALAGLMDNNETKSLSKIPVIGDIPVLGALFKSKSFQSNESELMFIVTAQIVKPVNRDDLPNLRNVEDLKTGSPLGIETKDGIVGQSGFSTGTSSTNTNVTVTPQTPPPAIPQSATPTTPAAKPGSLPVVPTTAVEGTTVSSIPSGGGN